MSGKRLHRTDMNSSSAKKTRRSLITFEAKLDIVRRCENNERSCDIARSLNLSQSTVRTILLQSDKIKERSKRLTSLLGARFVRPRTHTIESMEKRLVEWIKSESEGNNTVSFVNIQEKAKELYEVVKKEQNVVEEKPFRASAGWLDRFKKRMKVFNLNSPTERAKANNKTQIPDKSSDNDFSSVLKGVIEEGGYSPKQIFSVNEFGLLWRRSPFSGDVNIYDKDRLTLILGANAEGDCKLKPVVIYHSPNPVALRGYSKDHFPVTWKYQPRGIVTSKIFTDFFNNNLINELKDYCLRVNIAFKILLILKSAACHPTYLEDFSENIRVFFLPPEMEMSLHPMNTDVIRLFNAHYFHLILERIDGEMTDGERTFDECKENFTIKNAIDLVGQAWERIDQSYLKCVWSGLCYENTGEDKSLVLLRIISKVNDETIALANTIGFQLSLFEASKLLYPPEEELTRDELRQLKDEGESSDDDDCGIRTLSPEDIFEAFRYIKAAASIFDENDYDRVRSVKVIKDLENVIQNCRQIYRNKLKHSTETNSFGFIKMEEVEGPEIDIEPTQVKMEEINESSKSNCGE